MNTNDNAPLIAAGGGGLLFISLFISWFGEGSGWELFDFTDIVLAAIGLLAVAVGVGIVTGNPINPPGGPGGALTTAGLIALGMVATLIFEGDERKFGLFLALVAVIAIIVGALGLRAGNGAAPRAPRTSAPPPSAPPPTG